MGCKGDVWEVFVSEVECAIRVAGYVLVSGMCFSRGYVLCRVVGYTRYVV